MDTMFFVYGPIPKTRPVSGGLKDSQGKYENHNIRKVENSPVLLFKSKKNVLFKLKFEDPEFLVIDRFVAL